MAVTDAERVPAKYKFSYEAKLSARLGQRVRGGPRIGPLSSRLNLERRCLIR